MSEHHDDADPRLGPDSAPDRRAELLGAAAADDLSPAESQELDAMAARDPELADELIELRELSEALHRNLGSLSEEAPPASLREKVLAQVHANQDGPVRDPVAQDRAVQNDGSQHEQHGSRPAELPTSSDSPTHAASPRPSRRGSRLRQSLALAACVAVGVAGTLGVQAVLDTDPSGADPDETADGLVAEEPLGPPGELGSQEPVSFSDPGAGVEVDGALVAHTWGTETVLVIDGLTPGDAFTVVLVGADGQEIESGSFLGSEVPVDCRMNGAVLREDVERLEIRDDAGQAITAAALPDVD